MKIVSGELSLGFCAGLIAAIIIHALCQSTKASASEAVSESEDATKTEYVRKKATWRHLCLDYEIQTIKGHEYLILWNSTHGCCAIHAESCPCKSGAHTN